MKSLINESYGVFFLVIPPGLEQIGLRELKRFETTHQCQKVEMKKGGVQFHATIGKGLELNQLLKIPTRILLRLFEFTARDISRFHQQVSQFKWDKFIAHPTIKLNIHCSKCRLLNTSKITRSFEKSYQEYQTKNPFKITWKKESWDPPEVFIRGESDKWIVSFNTSGEALYKRGYQKIRNKAPIRENLASAILQYCLSRDSFNSFLDPMCGSGTFPYEALTINKKISTRSFAFYQSPFYSLYLSSKKLKPSEQSPFGEITGSDRDEKIISKIQTPQINFSVQDFWALKNKADLVLTNPPYGKRVKQNQKDYYQSLKTQLQSLSRKYYGFVAPVLDVPYSPELEFNHGGIKVGFFLFSH